MRFLVLANRFARPGDNRWLMDDLVDSFVMAGHEVDVVVGDLGRARSLGRQVETRPGVTVHSVGPSRTLGPVGKILAVPVQASLFRLKVRRLCSYRTYDVVLFTSLSFLFGRAAYVARRSGARVGLILWDFFPIHHSEIGLVPGIIPKSILKLAERLGVGRPDVAFLMSDANIEFFKTYFGDVAVKYVVCPPWVADRAQPLRPELTAGEDPAVGPLRALFGGQLVSGRGLEVIVGAAELLKSRGSDLKIVVAGDGPRKSWLISEIKAKGLSNVEYVGHLDRDAYGRLLESVHVGIAATVPGVTAPTFPSKIADYSAHGLALLVSTESASDVGSIIEDSRAGVAIEAGSSVSMVAALESLERSLRSGEMGSIRSNSRTLYNAMLSADAAAATIAGSFT